ncbi:MAG TPA: helix-turn-helix domain-containing protein [Gammaproteobacteria bacterium]
MKRKLHFAVIAVDGSITSSVYGPIELVQGCGKLQASIPELDPCEISTEVLSPDGRPFLASSGYRMPVDGGLKDLPPSSVIFFSGFGLPSPDLLPAMLERHADVGAWLEQQHARGATIAATCTGNFLLAENGLLRRKATTHWLYAELFRRRYPRIGLDLDAAVVQEERVFSVGGGVCGLDTAVLTVIERFLGREVARICTKLLVLESRRPSELRYEERQPAVRNDPLVDKAVDWIRRNLSTPLTVDDLLRQLPTSRRTLNRRFKLETGEGIQSFIQRLRIDRAKLLLETSNLPIEQIVDHVGYRDKSAFARQFKRHTRLTPQQYRQRYGSPRLA